MLFLKKLLFQLIILTTLGFISINAYPVIVGGYTDVNIKEDKIAKEAIDFAIKRLNKGKLSKVILIQKQVVNGINYKMQLEIINDSNKKKSKYEIVLHKPFAHNMINNHLDNFIVLTIKKI